MKIYKFTLKGSFKQKSGKLEIKKIVKKFKIIYKNGCKHYKVWWYWNLKMQTSST